MTEEQQKLVVEFIKNYDLSRMSRNIRKIFFDYLRHQKVGLPTDFEQILYDVDVLFEFLDAYHPLTSKPICAKNYSFFSVR